MTISTLAHTVLRQPRQMSGPGRHPPARSGSGSSQGPGPGPLQHHQPQQGIWNNLSMMSSFPSGQTGNMNGYDRYPGPLSHMPAPPGSLNENGLPMSTFPHQSQSHMGNGSMYNEEPRRISHQAVEMAASALANLGNGNSSNPPSSNSTKQEPSDPGPSQRTSRPVEDAGGDMSASGTGNKKKRKPKQGEKEDDDGRRKTARACDQCVSTARLPPLRRISLLVSREEYESDVGETARGTAHEKDQMRDYRRT